MSKRRHFKKEEKVAFQASFFQGDMLVFGGESKILLMDNVANHLGCITLYFDGKKLPPAQLVSRISEPSTVPSGKLTWQWKMDQLKMYSLLKMGGFSSQPC